MIHEIFPHRFDNQYAYIEHISNDDYFFYFQENSLLMLNSGDTFTVPQKKDFTDFPKQTKHTFLFRFNDKPCFLLWDLPASVDNRFTFQEISFFRTIKNTETGWISLVSYHLMNWYKQNLFCGKCGSKTREKTDERAIECTSCGNTIFPKISPAIIVAIVSNNKILLANNKNFRSNWYSLVAGYVDVGESLEETVIREVKEEVGLDVTNIRYYKSQPWPLSGSIMLGFVAEADENQTIQPDNIEITHAAWFRKGELPNHPPLLSIAGEMIDKFEKGIL